MLRRVGAPEVRRRAVSNPSFHPAVRERRCCSGRIISFEGNRGGSVVRWQAAPGAASGAGHRGGPPGRLRLRR
jgi:hypothetical protein